MSTFILSAFADEGGDALEQQIRVLEQYGIGFVEFRSADGKNISQYTLKEGAEAAQKLRDRGIGISALGSPIGKIFITDDFAPHLKEFRHVVELAQEMEAPYIRMFSFYTPDGADPAAYRGQVIDQLGQMVDAAAGSGITLLHENEKGIYGDIPERCLDILTAIDSPMFRATYDFSNFVQCGVDNDAAYAMLKPYIEYVHLKDSVYSDGPAQRDLGRQVTGNVHRPIGLGDGKVEKILTDLWHSDFEGFVSVEPHLGEEYGETSEARFGAAASAAKSLLDRVTKG